MSASGAVRIERPFEDLAGLLLVRPRDWVEPFLRIAAHTGESVAARSRNLAPPPGRKEIAAELLAPIAGESSAHLAVPLRWRAGGFTWIPPMYAGRIVIRRASRAACDLGLEGSYRLPESAGDHADARTVALALEAMVATFLRSLRAAIEEQARDPR